MAVNTQAKRFAALGLRLALPDGTIDDTDRANLVGLYFDAGPPPNDNWADATDMGGSPLSFVTGDNRNATVEIGEPDNSVSGDHQATVWWSWTSPPEATAVTFSTDGSVADDGGELATTLAVFTGPALASLTEVVADADAPSTVTVVGLVPGTVVHPYTARGEEGRGGRVGSLRGGDLDELAGTTFWIQVGGQGADDIGTIRLSIEVTTMAVVRGGPVGGDAVVPGGFIVDPSLPPPDPRRSIRADLYELDAVTLVGALDDAYDRTWQDLVSDVGSGGLTLPWSDPAAPTIGDRVVRFTLAPVHGTEAERRAVYQIVTEKVVNHRVAQGEESAQNIEVTGRGIGCRLEEGIVLPSFGLGVKPVEDTRQFDFASTVYTDGLWGHPADLGRMDDPHPARAWVGAPRWPDAEARIIWSHDSTISQSLARTGTCYFRKEFTVADDGTLVISAVSDDAGVIYLDGQKIMDTAPKTLGLDTMSEAQVEVTAGPHLLAAAVTNTIDPSAGLCLSAAMLLPGEERITVVSTDTTWKVLEFPASVPGLTPGRIVRVLIGAAQLRGALVDLDISSFDGLHDSDGNPWPVTSDIGIKVGADLLSVLNQLAESYIDWRMAPSGFKLLLYNIDGLGRSTTVGLAGGVNVTSLDYETVH